MVSISKISNNKDDLIDKEKNWMHRLNIHVVNSFAVKKLDEWDVRLDKSQLENWLRDRKIFKLFFYGASKGNPGRAGGGGVVINPVEKLEIEYY